jgi:hypothetical protein
MSSAFQGSVFVDLVSSAARRGEVMKKMMAARKIIGRNRLDGMDLT